MSKNNDAKAKFDPLIKSLREIETQINEPKSELTSRDYLAHKAFDQLYYFIRKETGYRIGWISDALIEHCSKKGRSPTYTFDEKIENCHLIFWLIQKGASLTQAAGLLARFHGDLVMSKSRTNSMTKAYGEFEKMDYYQSFKESNSVIQMIEINSHLIPYYLKFQVNEQTLITEEKASKKAAQAFREICHDVITFMKDNHKLVSKNDDQYPEIFGCVIDWINSDFDDPLDYFFSHSSHQEVDYQTRQKCLLEYLNAALYFNQLATTG